MNRLSITHYGTNAIMVSIGEHCFFYSYSTCVAYSNSEMQIKLAEKISKTTSRHLTEMGCSNFMPLTAELFTAGVHKACGILGFNLSI